MPFIIKQQQRSFFMKTILLTLLLTVATVATASETQSEKTVRQTQVSCLILNQRYIADYLICRERCLRQKTNKNRAGIRPAVRCPCVNLNNVLNFCG